MTDIEDKNDLLPEDEPSQTPKLGPANYFNVVLWMVSSAVLYTAEFSAVFGEDLKSKTKKHQTILSPKHEGLDTVFLIWHAITFFELLFVIFQLTPWFRVHELTKVITPWWILNCTLQIAWVIATMMELSPSIPATLVMVNFTVLMILIGRVELHGGMHVGQYIVFRAPFAIHAGFMMCHSVVWINALLQLRDDNKEGVVVATSMTGMTAVLTIATVSAIGVPRPDGLFCLSVAWVFWWVFRELVNPIALRETNIDDTVVSNEVLQAFCYSALCICFITASMGVLAFALRFASWCQTGRL